ncbi:hypothetical protein E2C01_012797 [Portunus trituberculatus]|uniref:Uncharacterized protein n=1 Tax=Portunus trituberculatus TaxID=210409 RepID=A0A5B7DFL0_PORTR|nr:hypothetical protein [Portunus trituberculatus]
MSEDVRVEVKESDAAVEQQPPHSSLHTPHSLPGLPVLSLALFLALLTQERSSIDASIQPPNRLSTFYPPPPSPTGVEEPTPVQHSRLPHTRYSSRGDYRSCFGAGFLFTSSRPTVLLRRLIWHPAAPVA